MLNVKPLNTIYQHHNLSAPQFISTTIYPTCQQDQHMILQHSTTTKYSGYSRCSAQNRNSMKTTKYIDTNRTISSHSSENSQQIITTFLATTASISTRQEKRQQAKQIFAVVQENSPVHPLAISRTDTVESKNHAKNESTILQKNTGEYHLKSEKTRDYFWVLRRYGINLPGLRRFLQCQNGQM